ncbi:serpin family protein [Streptomyces sp. NPDC059080]|uniref:serpin family protein n=1 Tax=Streptomyces sp. NPDC059080 TaxID=3346718 RepID=UPI00368856CB
MTPKSDDTTVRAVNAMTARWARAAVGERGTVLAAAGVWPLLALLATPAAGRARAELSAALGTAPEHAMDEARALLATVDAMDGTAAAAGVWAARSVALCPEWRARLPEGALGELTGEAAADRAALDAWARRGTDGMIERMPVTVGPGTLLVLASALLLRTTWETPFAERPVRPAEGPWAGRTLTELYRRTEGDAGLRVHTTPDGPVTDARVAGTGGLDVHLLLGPERLPGAAVLAHGVAALGGAYPVVPGAEGNGPGLALSSVPSPHGRPLTELSTARWTVDADHDLLRWPEVFGLGAAVRASAGHFPGIATRPLAVSAARQTATATFGPLGFRAAAVTAIGMRAAGMVQPPPLRSRLVTARFTRPFGFLAVHRASGLVPVAGWVTDPDPYPAV